MKKKLAIITTHPIQYNSPWFKLLNDGGNVRPIVFYTWSQAERGVEDRDFGKKIIWDVSLTEGYDYRFVRNISKQPGTHHRRGIINPTLIAEIEREQPDAVLVFGWNFISHGQVLKHFKGKLPVYFRGDSTLLDAMPGWKQLLRRLYLRTVYRSVDVAFYVGKENRKYFYWVGLQKEQLCFAPHAIDNDRFADDRFERHAISKRKELGYSSQDIVLLYAGKLINKKGLDLLIKAVTSVNKSNENKIQLLIIGNGELETEIAEVSRQNRWIKWLPFVNQSEMPVFYRVADFFCLPSRGPGETWGLSVNEAMAAGRSVLVSDRAGSRADLVKFPWGRSFDSGSFDSLLEGLHFFTSKSRAELHRNGRLAQDFIRDYYTFGKIVAAVEKELNAT